MGTGLGQDKILSEAAGGMCNLEHGPKMFPQLKVIIIGLKRSITRKKRERRKDSI